MILHSLWNDLFDEETIRKQLDIARHRRAVEQGRAEGIAEGEKIGMNKARVSLAKKLIALGSMSHEEIAKITELPLEQIDELAS